MRFRRSISSSENVVPNEIQDYRTVTYNLAPQVIVPTDQLMARGRAAATRHAAGRGAARRARRSRLGVADARIRRRSRRRRWRCRRGPALAPPTLAPEAVPPGILVPPTPGGRRAAAGRTRRSSRCRAPYSSRRGQTPARELALTQLSPRSLDRRLAVDDAADDTRRIAGELVGEHPHVVENLLDRVAGTSRCSPDTRTSAIVALAWASVALSWS